MGTGDRESELQDREEDRQRERRTEPQGVDKTETGDGDRGPETGEKDPVRQGR